jgi:integrase
MAGNQYRREKTNEPGVYRLIRVSDGEWTSTQVFYRVGTKQRVKTFPGRDTLTAAKRWQNREVDAKETDQRIDPASGRITLGEVWDEQHTSRAYAPKTLQGRADIRRKPALANLFAKPLNRIGREMVNEAIATTTSSPGMAREVRKSLRSAFSYATKVKGIEFPKGNPASSAGLKSTRVEAMAARGEDVKRVLSRAARGEDVKRVLSRAEVSRLIVEVPDQYKALVELLARVGLRPGEAYALTVGQLNPTARTLTIDRSASGSATKTGRNRVIPIPTDLVETLVAHIERFVGWDPEALLFTTETGSRRLDEHNWRRRVFQPASMRTGVNHGLRPYDLRHTALSTALSLGIDPATVANMAGHDVRTLLSTYTHALEEAKSRAADILGAAWSSERPATEAEVIAIGEAR